MTLKSCGIVVRLAPWSANIGAKREMEIVWLKVSNIPTDMRHERTVAYVASLVGVLLEIDYATLFRPESIRVRVGCRGIDEIPPVAEDVLGTHFYDFFYELDKMVS